MDNLIAAGKCLGVTHITNGCYRVHPVEWNVGETAGALAVFALEQHRPPRAIRGGAERLRHYQELHAQLGIQLGWSENIRQQSR